MQATYLQNKRESLLYKQIDTGQDYGISIRANVRGFWKGEYDMFGFVDAMVSTIRRGFTRAWHEGARAVGIEPNELTSEELAELETTINGEISHIYGFALEISGHDKASGGKLAPLLSRAEMWSAKYLTVKSHAMMMAGGDKKLKWVINPVKEHCSDCVRLDGRVYRASIWARYNLRPRMRLLKCGGWRCGCRFEVTNDPVTPGRPPSIAVF
jgi:hypothetical protein